MRRKRKLRPPRRRSAMAVIARRLGRRVKPSGKLYKRRPKHKKDRSYDGRS